MCDFSLVSVNGELLSLTKACKVAGVPISTVKKYRRELGLSKQEALDRCIDIKNNLKFEEFDFNGNMYTTDPSKSNYMSIVQVADELCINRGTFTSIVNRKGSIKDGIKYVYDDCRPNSGRCIKVTVNGKEFKSLNEACRSVGLKPNTVRHMVYKNGVTLEEAIQFYLNNGTADTVQVGAFSVNGIEYKNMKDAFKKLKWSRYGLVHTMDQYNLSIIEAFEFRVNRIKSGKLTKEELACCKKSLDKFIYAYTGRSGINYFMVLVKCVAGHYYFLAVKLSNSNMMINFVVVMKFSI